MQMPRVLKISCFVIVVSFCIQQSFCAEVAKTDARYPFRTDFANADLPWYAPKPLEFPPHHSDHRVSGELVSADFIHRKGQFRMTKTGELVDFTLPPYGAIDYLFASADLRDVPLGTYFLFFLNQDENGGFTRLATMQDQYSMDASHGFSYRLDEMKLSEGKLLVTKRSIAKKLNDIEKKELHVSAETRVWKGDKPVKLDELKTGDDLLYNLTGKTAENPGRCLDIWIGADTHALASDNQRKKFAAFTKFRGLPGWIEKTDKDTLTVTLFSGDSQNFQKTWMGDFAAGKEVHAVVANDELRTWNPPVDNERGTVLEVQKVPTDCYGCSGVRLVIKVNHMLEGFRKGRVLRVFGSGWKLQDQLYGENLMGYGFGRMMNQELIENVAKEYPEQFPFRTDYCNTTLPWFQLKPGVKPPPFAEHVVLGELVKADAAARSGQFRTDRKGDVVDFTLIAEGTVKVFNVESKLDDLPIGTRCRFHLFQDEKGAFTKASFISDEFSHFASNFTTCRVESLRLAEGKIYAAHQIPEVQDYNGDMKRPPDIGRSELRVTPETRVWKGSQAVKLSDISAAGGAGAGSGAGTGGDALLFNITAEQPGKPAYCTDIWVGEDTHKLVIDAKRKEHDARLKKK